MAQVEKSTLPAASASLVGDLGEMAKKRIEATAAVPTELFKTLEEISERWTARAKSEADLVSELMSKLTCALRPGGREGLSGMGWPADADGTRRRAALRCGQLQAPGNGRAQLP